MEPIKRLDDLTFQEISAIQIGSANYNRLIDLECAHAGISLLPEDPGPKPDMSEAKADKILYKIGSFGFATVTDAQDVIEFMVSKGLWKAESRKGTNVLERMEQNDYYWPEIKNTPVFSETHYATVKDSLNNIVAIQAEWKEKKDEYDAVLKERQAVMTKFSTEARYATEVLTGIAKIRDNLKRYLTLAQGQYAIAVTFLKEADKHGSVYLDEDCIFYTCSCGKHHLVTSRSEYQQESMKELLSITD